MSSIYEQAIRLDNGIRKVAESLTTRQLVRTLTNLPPYHAAIYRQVLAERRARQAKEQEPT